MGRWRANLPRYRTPIIIQRIHEGAASRTGIQKQGSNVARVLKVFDTVNPDNVDRPTAVPPATHFTSPGAYSAGWTAWWGAPPDNPPSPYKIPDPPTIPRPVLPTRLSPVLWEAYADVGADANAWKVRISAVYTLCELLPKTGKEQMSGNIESSVQEMALKIRPNIIATAGIVPREWDVILVEDNSHWQLQAITPSFRRGEFVELMVKNHGVT